MTMTKTRTRQHRQRRLTGREKTAAATIRSPSRSERRDMTTPCGRCGATPTIIIMRGRTPIERACPTCGQVTFLDIGALTG